MSRTKLIAIIGLIAVVVLFILQNTQVVELRFLFWKLSMSRIVLSFVLLAIGATLGWAANSAYRNRRRR